MAVLALLSIGCAGTSLAGAADVAGAGSTFVHPVMLKWASSYFAKTGQQVSYQSVGSSVGIRRIKEGSVSFGASDKPLGATELQAAGLAQFPLVIGGVVPVVNLEGIGPGQLALTGELLADIYLGKVVTWDDPAIADLNPGLKLPHQGIAVAYRQDGSGTTFNWTKYLSTISESWKSKVGEGTTVNWPVGAAGNGNQGVARLVESVPGSIGYVELAYAVSHRMTTAKLRNSSGAWVEPGLASFGAAASSASWTAPDFHQLLINAPGPDAWPIAATVFVLMPRRSADPARTEQALRFFRWALEEGQADARGLLYVPLPDDLVKRVQAYWAEGIQ